MTLDGAEPIAKFSSYVPQAVLRRLRSLPARPDEPGADQFPAALLLVDITGFTSVTASAVGRGVVGTEQLSRSLNEYLGQIIDLVTRHGGDVAKFVGDALISMWTAEDGDLATAARRAAACGLAIARDLDELEVGDGQHLSLRVGLCAGEVAATHVGGLGGKWLFLVAGDAATQLSDVASRMETGSLVASGEAWLAISNHFVGEPLVRGLARIRSTQQELMPRPVAPIELGAGYERSVRAYIPNVTLARLDAGQAAWLAEMRRTTVVFVNVVGVGTATPQGVTLLQRVTLAAQHTLERYDGWLKEITMDEKGTTLVAAFGVPPFTHEDDASRALRAALMLQAEIRKIGLSAGVGVATGTAFCGPVGNASRRDFVVLGQHVNLAARLMKASEYDGVLCDAETQGLAHEMEAIERLPPYVLKGMSTPTEVYRVRSGVVAAERSPDLVDRISELAAASAAVSGVKAGAGGLIVVEGEPGIGKSRVVDELVRRARDAGIRTVVGPAAEIEGSTSYHAWRAVFERLLALEAVADHESRRMIVLDRLGPDEATSKLAPLLDPVLSLDLADNEVTSQLSGAVRADNTRELLVGLLQGEASSGPLMVVLEDAHWLDSASWALLHRVRREIPSLLFVITMRPMGHAAADPIGPLRGEATTLSLAPLSRDDVVALACERTGASWLADEVADVVHQRAEGNPLFIEQLTYAMRDAGRIVVDNGQCRVAPGGEDLDPSIIPDTVQRVITTRLDQLPPAEALTLKVASVIGQRFAMRTLGDIYPIPTDTATLVNHLNLLTRLDLVAPATAAPEPAYEFRHIITQEVAYNLMLSEQSRGLHGRLAEWYERTYAPDLTPFRAFLAHHWRRAGLPGRAVEHLEQAGTQALRTFANDEAIGFFEQAVSIHDEAGLGLDAGRRARWQLQLGEAHVHMSRYREGRHHLEIGLQLMRRSAPATRLQQGIWLLGELIRQGLRRAGLARGVRSLTDADREELVVVCRAYERLAEASYYSRETLLPLYCVIRILNEAEASGSPAEIARGFAGSGALLGVVPLPRLAEWYLRRALERLGQVDDLTTHEIVDIVVGFYYIGAARWDLARERLRSVRRIARRLGDRRRLDDAVANLMELEYLQGNFRASLDLAGELMTTASVRGDNRFRAEALTGHAYNSWLLGNATGAFESMAELRAIVTEDPGLEDDLRIKYFGLLAMLHAGRADNPQALAACEEALRLTSEVRPSYFGAFLGYLGPAEVYLSLWERGYPMRDPRGNAAAALDRLRRFANVFPVGRPRFRLLNGRYAWQLGRHDRAMKSWRRALTGAQDLAMDYEQALAHLEISRHLEEKDPARASHDHQAREILSRIGAPQPTWGA